MSWPRTIENKEFAIEKQIMIGSRNVGIYFSAEIAKRSSWLALFKRDNRCTVVGTPVRVFGVLAKFF
jgi:hypothetical protein